jgi:hypothetical protein
MLEDQFETREGKGKSDEQRLYCTIRRSFRQGRTVDGLMTMQATRTERSLGQAVSRARAVFESITASTYMS